jgi:hypothetical protein
MGAKNKEQQQQQKQQRQRRRGYEFVVQSRCYRIPCEIGPKKGQQRGEFGFYRQAATENSPPG